MSVQQATQQRLFVVVWELDTAPPGQILAFQDRSRLSLFLPLIEITHALEKLFHIGKPQLCVVRQVLAEGMKLAGRDLVALDGVVD
jgi:hypothetical protein